MFKLGSYLLFITFTQLIIAILFIQSLPGVGINYTFENIHPLIKIIVLLELSFSGFLIYKGYSKIDKTK
ncbi:hypothetical protein [Clostridium sp. KNHs214]|uniref:hypothetical protein n=1 Tax=Clostridium sp. KNHs214 TaxID=1540257 RepID=UPI00054FA040|nr:hypothetical protein [Clostridium sp. KNHs214]